MKNILDGELKKTYEKIGKMLNVPDEEMKKAWIAVDHVCKTFDEAYKSPFTRAIHMTDAPQVIHMTEKILKEYGIHPNAVNILRLHPSKPRHKKGILATCCNPDFSFRLISSPPYCAEINIIKPPSIKINLETFYGEFRNFIEIFFKERTMR